MDDAKQSKVRLDALEAWLTVLFLPCSIGAMLVGRAAFGETTGPAPGIVYMIAHAMLIVARRAGLRRRKRLAG
jgi:hypothetical protein